MEWIRTRATIYSLGDVSFMMKNTSGEYTPFKGSSDNPERFLAGVEAVASSLGKSDLQIFVHESYGSIIEEAHRRSYTTWDPVDGPNILVFRYI